MQGAIDYAQSDFTSISACISFFEQRELAKLVSLVLTARSNGLPPNEQLVNVELVFTRKQTLFDDLREAAFYENCHYFHSP